MNIEEINELINNQIENLRELVREAAPITEGGESFPSAIKQVGSASEIDSHATLQESPCESFGQIPTFIKTSEQSKQLVVSLKSKNKQNNAKGKNHQWIAYHVSIDDQHVGQLLTNDVTNVPSENSLSMLSV